jgi:gliding motility-associated-like protein
MKQILLVIVFMASVSAFAQKDMRGTDFWLTFGANWRTSQWDGVLELQIRIVSRDMPTSGTIYFTPLGTSIPFSVQPREVFTYKLTDTERDAVYNTSQGISNSSIRITCDYPITAYALNQYVMSADATNLLPVTALGTDYYQISYIPGSPGERDAYAVIATENNTKLYHIDRTTPIATLDAGQVYYKVSNTDMTGNHIFADKPIALFALNQGVYIPHLGTDSRDCLMQQLAPINTWGRNFFVPVSDLTTPWYNDTRDRVRVVASQNNTTITQSGGTLITNSGGQSSYTIDAGQFIELEITLNNNGCYIRANKPVGVCAYLTSRNYNNGDFSDPSQAWLPSVEQMATDAVIAPFIPTGYSQLNAHYALIITPTATKDSTTVKIGNGTEQSLSGGVWHDHSSGYSFYDMPLSNDTSAYLFSNADGGLIVMGYGTGRAESYYYLLASAMRNLEAWFDVNKVYYQSFDGSIICDENIKVEATVKYPMDTAHGHLRWQINGVEQTAFTDSLRWTMQLPQGKHTIVMIVKDQYGETDSMSTSFVVSTSVFVTIYDTICQGQNYHLYNFNLINVQTSTTDKQYLINAVGCDSIVTLNLHVNAVSNTTFHDTICPNNSYANHGFTISADNLQTAGIFVFRDTLSNVAGCDSLIILQLTVLEELPLSVNLGNDTTICWLDSLKLDAKHADANRYQWQDGSTGVTYTVYFDGQYWVIISNPCSSASDTINITYLKEIDFNLGNDTVICEDALIYRELDVTSPYASYLWQDGSTSPFYIIKEAGIYSVTVSNACISVSKAIEITTKDCNCNLWLPNFFSPNGDGMNDEYIPNLTGELHRFQMIIFDRWGMVMYKTEEFIPWNGKTNGRDASAGVYFCVVEYFCKDNPTKKRTAQGSVTLVR